MEMTEWIERVMMRDLESLTNEIEAYDSEESVWAVVPGATNSPGTLTLHIAGNIQHFIGSRLGGTGYVRNREAEFSRRDVKRSELLEEIGRARKALMTGIRALKPEQLRGEYPEKVGGVKLSTGQVLVHLAAHLAYHLGQVDYHRRIVTGATAIGGNQSLPALASDDASD